MNLIKEVPASDKRQRRESKWIGIIIHHTGISDGIRKNPECETLWSRFNDSMINWLTKKDEHYLSAHYQIGRAGQITKMVDPVTHEAFHAGRSEWFNPETGKVQSDCNARFIGIELLGDGNVIPYSDEQYQQLAYLCAKLMRQFDSISPFCIVGHQHVSPGRKPDPGRLFDWRHFNKRLYECL